jgi:hypothetical protein
MIDGVEERDWWAFRELYSVLIAFADEPAQAISHIGGGRISLPEDQANHLDHFYNYLRTKYPEVAQLELMTLAAFFNDMLAERSRGGALFDEYFWTNDGFQHHPDWIAIRTKARQFLIR